MLRMVTKAVAHSFSSADDVLGADRLPTEYETVASLRYSDAVLRESLRLKRVAPCLFVEPLSSRSLPTTAAALPKSGFGFTMFPAGLHVTLRERAA